MQVLRRRGLPPDRGAQTGTPFVIQGGDLLGTGTGGPGYTIADEPVATAYKRGTVAMACPRPRQPGLQFFIVLSDEAGPILQSANTYAIFGNVVSGLEVADAIFQASGGAELLASPIEMTSVTVGDVPPSPSPAASAPRARPRPWRRPPPPPPPPDANQPPTRSTP